ncbi:ABC-2 family transporter protein [Candidatus Dojkabacteria bacterium]|nr:ABC-2 family transporter protein [Candidatus Dojkabacteria bacterium]
MKKYLQLFKNYLGTMLEYRANLVGIIILELISIGEVLILWIAIFRSENEIRGFTFGATLLYYLIVPLIGFITQVDISSKRSQEIRSGELSKYLLKPYNLWLDSLAEMIARKIHTLVLILPIYLIIIVTYSKLLPSSEFKFYNILLALAFASGGFLLHFIMDLFISWLAFWVTDVWSFRHFKYILFSVFGGLSFPFDLLPANIRTIFENLPFKYFYYVPISYFSGSRNIQENILSDLAGILLWLLIFFISGLILWKKGIKKYEAFGN